jgi:hypothetical protein
LDSTSRSRSGRNRSIFGFGSSGPIRSDSIVTEAGHLCLRAMQRAMRSVCNRSVAANPARRSADFSGYVEISGEPCGCGPQEVWRSDGDDREQLDDRGCSMESEGQKRAPGFVRSIDPNQYGRQHHGFICEPGIGRAHHRVEEHQESLIHPPTSRAPGEEIP